MVSKLLTFRQHDRQLSGNKLSGSMKPDPKLDPTLMLTEKVINQLKARGIEPNINLSKNPEDTKPSKFVQLGLSAFEKSDVVDQISKLEKKLGYRDGEISSLIDLKSILDEPMRIAVLNRHGDLLDLRSSNEDDFDLTAYDGDKEDNQIIDPSAYLNLINRLKPRHRWIGSQEA